MAAKGGTYSINIAVKVIYNPIEETESVFQPLMLQGQMINKIQEIVVTAMPDPGSHTAGEPLDFLPIF